MKANLINHSLIPAYMTRLRNANPLHLQLVGAALLDCMDRTNKEIGDLEPPHWREVLTNLGTAPTTLFLLNPRLIEVILDKLDQVESMAAQGELYPHVSQLN